MQEPHPQSLPTSYSRYLAATRPGFLSATLASVLLGLAAASGVAYMDYAAAGLTLLGALAAHASFNVLNDVFDHQSGSDAINTDRVHPFTGGSRVIQNRVLTPVQMLRFGIVLLLFSALAGVLLLVRGGLPLVAIGAAGLFLGWAYSAPPLRLCSRGFGELTVGIGFGILIPVGAALVQTGSLHSTALLAGVPYGALIAAVLIINQVPDFRADAATDKHNLVVLLGRERAWMLYTFACVIGYLALMLAVIAGALPALSLLGLGTAPLHIFSAWSLRDNARRPESLARPIRLTLDATLIHAAIVSVTLAAAG